MQGALSLIKPGGDHAPIGDAPGVYSAPEVKGVYWPQVGLTLLLGTISLLLGFAVFAAFLR